MYPFEVIVKKRGLIITKDKIEWQSLGYEPWTLSTPEPIVIETMRNFLKNGRIIGIRTLREKHK